MISGSSGAVAVGVAGIEVDPGVRAACVGMVVSTISMSGVQESRRNEVRAAERILICLPGMRLILPIIKGNL
jgi:hypothetical protein